MRAAPPGRNPMAGAALASAEVTSRGVIMVEQASTPPVESVAGLDLRACEALDTVPFMIWASGPDQRCAWFNRAWLDFTGPIAGELGSGWVTGIHPDDVARSLEIHAGRFDARQPFRIQYRRRRHDGAFRWIDDRAIPRHGSDGRFLGYAGSCVAAHDQAD